MKLTFNRYFISVLSALLIFSNFSFAASVMICGMMANGSTGKCCVQKTDNTPGVRFSKVRNSCCDQQTIVLSNSNDLLHQKDVNLLGKATPTPCCTLETDFSQTINGSNNFFDRLDRLKLPQDIPILVSSLLI